MSNIHSEQKPTLYRYHKNIKIEEEATVQPFTMTEYHYHDSYELYYLAEGERYYFIQNKSYHIESGSFVLINKYDIHSTISHQGSGYRRILFCFNESTLADFSDIAKSMGLLSCFRRNVPVIKLSPNDKSCAENILRLALREFEEKKKGYENYLRSSLIQLLTILNRYASEEKVVTTEYISAPHKTISEIAGYINIHFADEITLDNLSSKFHMSTHYISRIFKKFTGISMIDYLNNIRIKEAQKLIMAETMSMQQICEAVGYNNYTHFGRVFKEISGMTPLKYKNENKQGERRND